MTTLTKTKSPCRAIFMPIAMLWTLDDRKDWMERARMVNILCVFSPPSTMRWADQWCVGGRSRRIV